MNAQCRGLLGLGAALALLAAAPWWGPAVGLGEWDLTGLATRVQHELRREQELLLVDRESLARLDAREEVVEGLIAGRLTLREAGATFAALNNDPAFNREV